MSKQYVIGSGNAPIWCKNLLIPYRKMDGSVGYEFRGKWRDFDLNVGDVLIRCKNKIEIKRKAASE